MTWDARAEPPPAVLHEADVVLEGFRPGVWERLGVELRDTAILCSITGLRPGRPARGTGGPRPELPRLRRCARRHGARPTAGAGRRPRGGRPGCGDRGARRAARARPHRARRAHRDLDDARLAPVRRASCRRRHGAAPAHRRRRVLPHLRDSGQPVPDRGRARAEVLEAVSANCSSCPTSSTAPSSPSCPSSPRCSAPERCASGSTCSKVRTPASGRS